MQKEEITKKVIEAIDTIRPYLQSDGGDVEFKELTDDYVVKVQLQGACGHCPHAIATLKNGVETTVKRLVPEIKSVEAA
ncbi:MAG: NifU family protein [Bacteroidales bacterium]|jgi:Fe-S cluster biogenesis protein NfuA|nr:NifU family protein [Bacteroidales bacterium]